jgi:hypothetical protein
MKMKREEFKSLLKECLSELILEGGLNDVLIELMNQSAQSPQQHQHPAMQTRRQTDPRIKALAATNARNQQEAALLELAFSDSAQRVPVHMSADPEAAFNGYGGGYNDYNQTMNLPPAQPLFPTNQQNQGYQTMHPQQGANNGGYVTNWARLAFSTPIKNRPDSNSGGFGSTVGYLPGFSNGRLG